MQVQGMPHRIEKLLTKRLRAYLWDEKMSKVNMETALAPTETGGLKVLDVRARNEAIELMWIKRYLDFSALRPLWAKVLDAILASSTPKTENIIPQEIMRNVFLQTWKTSTGRQKKVIPTIRRMLEAAKKYNVRLEGIQFANEALNAMPIWLHAKANNIARQLATCPTAKCLIERHNIRTVGDTIHLTKLSENFDEEKHTHSSECECEACMNMETATGCMSPALCIRLAQLMIKTLPPKWTPRDKPTENSIIMPTEENEAEAARTLEEEGQVDPQKEESWTPFDRELITAKNITDAFRVFTEGDEHNDAIDLLQPQTGRELLMIGTDGSCTGNGEADAQAGAGIFAETNSDFNKAVRVPLDEAQSNQTGELLAVAEAGRSLPKDVDMFIETDSTYAKNAATLLKRKQEDSGYIGTANRKLIKYMVAKLRSRNGATIFRWVPGHTGVYRNKGAD
jgi:ribonuclease HI